MCIQKHMLKVQKAAERYLPTLEIKEGFPITMDDMDGIHVWSFRYMSEIASIFVPTIVTLSLFTFLGWYVAGLLGGYPEEWLPENGNYFVFALMKIPVMQLEMVATNKFDSLK
ncbi:PREDICTED: uncharacterized protein LOC109208217 isoform X3 [Nicotiana attenuata]|uniref:uncharacterized protein LOC109208217 isoform X3 n=1 Tax=Nicotiana attenuata TaxID=49451 RepID=UPI000904FCB1|nr:PREDICTED: uncharacterized protein LOC109208217 isoform X3 [Nicotiana attenuata]